MTTVTADQICSQLGGDVATRVACLKQLANDSVAAGVVCDRVAILAACDDEETINWSNEVLENLSDVPEVMLPKLIVLVEKSDDQTSAWALKLIGRVGDAAGSLQSKIVAALSDKRPTLVRENAAWALGRIGPLSAETKASLQATKCDPGTRLARLIADAIAS